jgi:hypothetical protein
MTTGSIPKIFPSANKIFTLSKYHPVGIMIYGAASFMGVPWETIIKIYQSKLCRTSFSELEGYAKDFINFIDKEQKREEITDPEAVGVDMANRSLEKIRNLLA